LRQRMKLFASVIQTSILYGCVSWTMTRQREQLLRTTQRRLLRMIVGTKRTYQLDQSGVKELENWVDWIQRATRVAENVMVKYGVHDWIDEVCKRKFHWAGHVSRRMDGRWSKAVLCWCPVGERRRCRPLMRWCDSINRFFDSMSTALGQQISWMQLAQDRDAWKALEQQFVLFCSR